MPLYIEILATNDKLYQITSSAIEPLNKVQKEFDFRIAPDTFKKMPFELDAEQYQSQELIEWVKEYRTGIGGVRPNILLVTDKYLTGNLFGNLSPQHLIAVFTTHAFGQFINDEVRFCRYYCIRYALSFLAPEIRSHKETKGCLFDKKENKRDLLKSLDTGHLCDDCKGKLKKHCDSNLFEAIKSMLKIISYQHPYAIIMKGGGVKGLALAGTLLELEKYFSFNTFAGTSAGAIAAVLLGAGYKPGELLQIFKNKDFNDFRDASWYRAFINLIVRGALYPGNSIETWLEEKINEKYPNVLSKIQMRDLHVRTVIYASRIHDGTLAFDTEGDRDDTIVSFATRCSMAIPYYFFPKKIEDYKVYDGGLRNNFPLTKFLSDNPSNLFIGLYIKSYSKNRGLTIKQLADIAIDGEERKVVDANRDKIVIIDTYPIKTTDFNLTDDDKNFLILSGQVAALHYITEYHKSISIDLTYYNKLKKELADIKKNMW